MTLVTLRNTEFYRPLPQELPWELIAAGSARHDLAALRELVDLDYTRIVCLLEEGTTLGIYSMRALSDTRFELLSVSVLAEHEHQLLGRRLLGHALGLAESKAGREVELEVCVDNTRVLDIVERYGFVRLAPESQEPQKKQFGGGATGLVRWSFELTAE